jgi:hypothetical protein
VSIVVPIVISDIDEQLSARFPHPEDFPDVSFTPTLLEPPTSTPLSLSPIEKLPLELLHLIISACTLASICNVASTSHYLRARLLSDGDRIAKTWMMKNVPCWVPIKDSNPWDEDEKKFDGVELNPRYTHPLGWNYLR